MANEVNIAVKTNVGDTTAALAGLNKQFTTAGANAAAALDSQITPALKRVGDAGESNFGRVGESANKMSMEVYYASYAFMPFANASPIFGALTNAVGGASGALSLLGPILMGMGGETKTVTSALAANTVAVDANYDGQHRLGQMYTATHAQQTEAIATTEALTAAEGEAAVAGDAAEASMGPLGIGVAAVAIGVGVLAAAFGSSGSSAKASASDIESYTTAIEQDNDAVGDNTKLVLANALSQSGSVTTANKLGISTAQFAQAMAGSQPAIAGVTAHLNDLIAAGSKYVTDGSLNRAATTDQTKALGNQSIAAQKLLDTVNTQTGVIGQASAAAQQHTAILAALGQTADDTADQVDVLSTSLQEAASINAGLYAQIGSSVNAMLAQSNASITAALDQDNFNNTLANFNTTLNGGGNSTKKAVIAVVDVIQDYSTAIDELSGNTLDAQKQQDQFQLSLLGLQDALAAATPTADQTSAVSGNTAGAINNRDAVLDQISAINQIANAQLKAGDATSDVTANMAANESQLQAAATAAGLASDEVASLIAEFAVNPGQLPIKVSADEAATAAAAAAKAADQLSASTANSTINLSKNKDAILQGIQSINQIAQAQEQANVPWDQINKTMQDSETQLEAVGVKSGMTKQQVDDLIQQFAVQPQALNLTVTADTAEATEKLAVLVALEDAAAGRALSPAEIIASNYAEAGLKGNSSGGVWSAATGGSRSGWGTMNEQGSEAVKLPSGSLVLSHPDTERMLAGASGGGSGQVNLSMEVSGNADSAVGQLVMSLMRGGHIKIRQQYVTS